MGSLQIHVRHERRKADVVTAVGKGMGTCRGEEPTIPYRIVSFVCQRLVVRMLGDVIPQRSW
jgi:hypothetical protein